MTILNKKYLQAIVLMAGFLFSIKATAQEIDTTSTFSITGYIDAYYAYYTDSVGPGKYQKFPTTSPRSNSPGLNIAQLSFQYSADKIRAIGVLHFGDVANSTWATTFNMVQEAHAGVKVVNKLWIDAGFFRTHFGTELLTPRENITSSVTVGTFHEPYYESGIRLNFDPTPKLDINVYLLNGYNVFIDNNEKKSLGMAINYTVNDKLGISYTNYIGDDSPPGTTVSHLRTHNNAYLNYSSGKIKLQVGADYCIQQNSDLATGKESASMYSALATIRYQCTNKLGIYGRGEVFSDPDGYMSTLITDKAGNKTGYKLTGFTLGGEYKPTPESYVKVEGRMLQMDSDQEIFYTNGKATSSRFEILVNAGVTFELLKRIATR